MARKKHSKKGPRRTGELVATDKFIGDRLRQIRVERGYTQLTLAEALGLAHQQVQKYETGANGISAARLCRIARLLEVAVVDFLPPRDALLQPQAEQPHGGVFRASLTASQEFKTLPPATQKALHTLIRALARGEDES